MIHVSVAYIGDFETNGGRIYNSNIWYGYIYNTISRFAVPCFIMLSGAFILSNEKNGGGGMAIFIKRHSDVSVFLH